MQKTLLWLAIGIVVLVGGFYALNAYIYNEKQGDGGEVATDGERQRPDVAPTGLIGGGWTWVRTELPGGEVMQAPAGGKFVLSLDEDGLAASTTDCNQMSGGYVKDEEVLSFKPFAMTKMYCEGSQEGVYAQQLAQTGSYVIEGNELRLILLRDAGTMVFVR